jgi:hypothetical protein
MSPLTLNVFDTGYTPVNGGPGWDSTIPATWPACTTTLISGDTDAVLVDALMTSSRDKSFRPGSTPKAKTSQASSSPMGTATTGDGDGAKIVAGPAIKTAVDAAAIRESFVQSIGRSPSRTRGRLLRG